LCFPFISGLWCCMKHWAEAAPLAWFGAWISGSSPRIGEVWWISLSSCVLVILGFCHWSSSYSFASLFSFHSPVQVVSSLAWRPDSRLCTSCLVQLYGVLGGMAPVLMAIPRRYKECNRIMSAHVSFLVLLPFPLVGSFIVVFHSCLCVRKPLFQENPFKSFHSTMVHRLPGHTLAVNFFW